MFCDIKKAFDCINRGYIAVKIKVLCYNRYILLKNYKVVQI